MYLPPRRSPAAWRVFFALLLGATSSALAQWPQFRGPNGDGHSSAKKVPLHWSASENVAWKIAVPGRGWSSPVLADGKVFLTSAVGPADGPLALSALAFDATSGKLLWSTGVFTNDAVASGIHRKNSHASPTPILDGDRVYVHFGHRGSAALDTQGRVLWRQTGLTYNPVHGNGGSPVLHQGKLIYLADGAEAPFIAALKAETGEVAWRVARVTDFPRTFSFATPSVFAMDGKQVLVAPASGFIAGHDPADGRELWRVRHAGWSVIPKPVMAHGLIFAGTGYETATTVAIRPGGAGDVTETHLAWTLRRGAPNTPSFLAVGEELYLLSDSGILSCVDARTGTPHYQERACGQSSASPILAEGRIYLLDEQGLGVVIQPGRTYQKLAENALGERTLASYAVMDGALFLRSEEHLFRIGR